ncbi:MAG: T9SS type A sorting domain-containing protein [Flavobacteriales bacterium]|nr:T9SS type A sorting domain-containing protein [Flavobacteriales bacterium]
MNFRWPCGRLGILLGCLGLVAVSYCTAQNLIFNPGFELVDSCPQSPYQGFGPGQRPLGWFKVNSSPDYFNRCQQYGNFCGVPLNFGGWQEPEDGDAYSGMLTYFHNSSLWHEMIGTELADPLTVGTTYYLSFYINAAAGGSEWPMMASSHFGGLFTIDAVEWENWMTSLPLRNYAQVYTPTVMSDTASWLLVSGSFVADSAYRYLVLGNHFDNLHAEADTIITQDSTAYLYRAYTYVDRVCLSTDPEGCPMAQGVQGHVGNDVRLYPNPATDALLLMGVRPNAKVTIYDALGRSRWRGSSLGGTLTLEVGDWSRGCYVVVIVEEADRRSMKFVLIE